MATPSCSRSRSEIEAAITRELGYEPLREVPVELVETVVRAEASTLELFRTKELSLLDVITQLWDNVCNDSRFESAPLAFQLDAFNRAGIAYQDRYARKGDEVDFRIAQSYYTKALSRTPEEAPEQARYAHNLGITHLYHYNNTGALVDLNRSLELLQRAAGRTDSEERLHALFRYSLGRALQHRYKRQGSLADLESSIFNAEQALDLVSADHPLWPLLMQHLGIDYDWRFLRTGAEEDIQRSVALQEEVLAHSPSNAYRLTNLGNSLLNRFNSYGQSEDLTRAVQMHQQAVDATEPGDRSLAIRLNNLGNSLSRLYEEEGEPRQLDVAVDTYQRTLRNTQPTDPLRTSRLYNLGRTLLRRHALSGRRSDRRAATRALRDASRHGQEQSLEWALAAAKIWGEWAAERGAWKEAEEAFGYGMQAIDSLYQTQLRAESRTSWLREARDLVTQAAYTLAHNRKLQEAVSALERGRARALNEALIRQEGLVEALPQPDRDSLRAALDQVEALQAELQASHAAAGRDFPTIAAELRRARAVLRECIDRIRSDRPDFMPQGLDFEAIAHLVRAVGHPLVYLLTSRNGSLALIVAPDERVNATARAVRMDGFNMAHLEAMLYGRDSGPGYLQGTVFGPTEDLQRVLDLIWPKIDEGLMRPVMGALRDLDARRAILVPTGSLTLLPLHAVADSEIVLSYVPSAMALKTVVLDQDHVDAPIGLLAVGDPRSERHPALRFAGLEARRIAAVFAAMGRPGAVVEPERATRAALAERLPGFTHLHFACHGRFEVESPLDSALFLAGEDRLMLRHLLEGELDVSALRLVTLSACQTGMTDFLNVPDEVVGFPAGFVQAGVPGVIGTLWPVDDVSTAILMTRFYEFHVAEGLEPAAALQGAQRWLRDATSQEMGLAAAYEVLFDESGRRDRDAFRSKRYFRANPSARPYRHPFFWAAFYFSGI